MNKIKFMIKGLVSLLQFTLEVPHVIKTSLINRFSSNILHHADCKSILIVNKRYTRNWHIYSIYLGPNLLNWSS